MKKNEISYSDISSSKMPNDSSNPFRLKNSSLIKIGLDQIDKNIDINENANEYINKIENKIEKRNHPDLYSRENQISKSVDEVIDIPKKKIKDEELILSDDKIKNQIKKKIMEEEYEKDKKKRKIEKDIDDKKIKELLKINETNRVKVKKNTILLFLKYMAIILFITGIIVYFILWV